MNIGGKPFNPGRLRTTVTLLRRTTSTGPYKRPTYESAGNVLVEWKNVHGSEVWAATAVQAVRPATITMRYVDGFDTTWAIQLDGEIFDVVSVDDIENRHELLEVKVKASIGG
jgi:SPP1 family predicted phage head-tail adaptor